MNLINDDDVMEFIGKQESQFFGKPSEWKDKVKARLRGEVSIKGDPLPWSKTHGKVALRPGEVSVWAGINGHGKSQLLGQVAAWCMNKKWLIASMEMLPEATLARMLRQATGTDKPTDESIESFFSLVDNNLWMYDQTDTVQPERIIGLIHYAATKLGVNHIIIDSLMKCGIKADDKSRQGEKSFVDALCWAAKAHNIHIHLVHHMRKGDSEGNVPDKFDVRGASEIVDLVDNLFIVHRNKFKEQRIAKGEAVKPDEMDCVLKVAKQRHGEWEGSFALWFHKPSMQYVPCASERPMCNRLMEERIRNDEKEFAESLIWMEGL